MGDYFIPLKTLLPFPNLARLPIIGPLFDGWSTKIGVRNAHETWNAEHCVYSGDLVIDGDITIPLFGFELALGAEAVQTVFRYEVAIDRASLLTMLVERGEEELGVEDIDIATESQRTQVFLKSDAPATKIRITILGTVARLRLPPGARLAEKVEEDGEVVGLREIDPPQRVELGISGMLVIDTDEGISFALDQDVLTDVPPFLFDFPVTPFGSVDLGIEAEDVKVDLSESSGIAEIMARPGYDETWKGLFIKRGRFYGLNELLSILPPVVEVTDFMVGTDGVTGTIAAEYPPPAEDSTKILHVDRIEFVLERDRFVKGTADVLLRLGQALDSDHISIGPEDGNLRVLFTLRQSSADAGEMGFDIALRSSATDEDGLLRLDQDGVAALQGILFPALIGLLGLTGGGISSSEKWVVGTLFALNVAQITPPHILTVRELKLIGLTGRYFTQAYEIDGVPRQARFVDFVLDGRVKVDFDVLILRTQRPVSIEVRGFTVRVAVNRVHDSIPRVQLLFDFGSGLSFEIGDQTLLRDVPLVIVKLATGRWEQGNWYIAGLRLEENVTAAGLSGAELKLYFLDDGALDHWEISPFDITVYFPQWFYARGMLKHSGATTEASLHGFASRIDPALDKTNPQAWLVEGDFAMVRTAFPDGESSNIFSLLFNSSSGIPLGTTGVGLYGGYFLLGTDAGPKLEGRDPDLPESYEDWYFQVPPANQISALKCEPRPDGGTVFGIGAILGSYGDRARKWNLKGGLVYLPGKLLFPVTVGLLTEPKVLADSSAATISGLVVIDLNWDWLHVSARVDWKKPSDGRLITLRVPGEIFLDWVDGKSHVYVGEHEPTEKMIQARVLGSFNLYGYLMFDIDDVLGLGPSDATVHGVALIIGVLGEFKDEARAGGIRAFFEMVVEGFVGLSDSPAWFAGAFGFYGAVGLKIYGIGFQISIETVLEFQTPEPNHLKFTFTIKIGFPWPIPDFKATWTVESGAEGNPPSLPRAVEGFTLHLRDTLKPIEIREDVLATDVPIDPAFTLNLSYPTRNATNDLGSFRVFDVDTAVKYHGTDDVDYAVDLVELNLWLGEVGTGTKVVLPTPIPAVFWPSATRAPANEKLRSVLQLFDYSGPIFTRYTGTGANFLDGAFTDWNPCAPTTPVKPVCYGFAAEPLGPIAQGMTIEVAGKPPVGVEVIPPAPSADSVRRFEGLIETIAAVAQLSLIDFNARCVRLPATIGYTTPKPVSTVAASTLQLTWERATVAELTILVPLRTGLVRIAFYDGKTAVLDTTEGTTAGTVGGGVYQRIQYRCAVPSTRAVITAWEQRSEQGTSTRNLFLHQVCLTYEADQVAFDDQVASGAAWDEFWSDLTDAGGATSDIVILEPDTLYSLEARFHWSVIQKPTVNDDLTHTFRFRTAATPPNRLLRDEAQAPTDKTWEIRTRPTRGETSFYRTRPIRMDFIDPRIDLVYRKFGKRLVLRLIDDQGLDLFDRLAFLAENATSLPEYQEFWRQEVGSNACAPGGIDQLWQMGTAHFDTVLERARWYDATLVPVHDPDGTVDLSTVDWSSLTPVYAWRFRTSRWDDLTQHAAAHVIRDEICAQPPELTAIEDPAAVGGMDDQAFERALYGRLHLAPRFPAQEPEVVRIWRVDDAGAGLYSLVGLFLDGPEALVRRAVTTLAVTDGGGSAIAHAFLHSFSGARSLLLFQGAFGFVAAPPGEVRIDVTDHYEDEDGNPASETARLTISVGTRPPFFDPEVAP